MARLLVTAVLLGFVGSPFAATGNAERAGLRLVDRSPVRIAGVRFVAHERVKVVASAGARTVTRRVVAGPRGGFVASFSPLALDRCTALVATAVGSRGSRTALKLPQPLCPPAL